MIDKIEQAIVNRDNRRSLPDTYYFNIFALIISIFQKFLI